MGIYSLNELSSQLSSAFSDKRKIENALNEIKSQKTEIEDAKTKLDNDISKEKSRFKGKNAKDHFNNEKKAVDEYYTSFTKEMESNIKILEKAKETVALNILSLQKQIKLLDD